MNLPAIPSGSLSVAVSVVMQYDDDEISTQTFETHFNYSPDYNQFVYEKLVDSAYEYADLVDDDPSLWSILSVRITFPVPDQVTNLPYPVTP